MIIIMCCIVGAGTALDSLVRGRRPWSHRFKSCISKRSLDWSREFCLGSGWCRCRVAGSIVWHLLPMGLFLGGDSMYLDSLALVILSIDVNLNSSRR